MYKVLLPASDQDGWISISAENSTLDSDSFVNLLKYIQEEIGGKIVQTDKNDIQYQIVGDKMHLIYQWDSCFGISVIVPERMNRELAYHFLEVCCTKLNKQINA
jgi:hypothetical protein